MKTDLIPLSEAVPGTEYIIDHIKNCTLCNKNLKGYGIIPKEKIKLLFASPSGDPYAYEVLGAVIALRREDSQNIFIKNTAAYD